MKDFLNFLETGGIFMIPLGICSILTMAFILERGFALRRSKIIPSDLYNTLVYLPVGSPSASLTQMATAGRSSLARLVRVSLEHLPWTRDENLQAVQSKSRAELIQLERGLVVLEIMTGMTPLLGLLGAISGLITIFSNVNATELSTQGAFIAQGIAEALHTTVAGLVIAIPALVAHSLYSKKIENLMIEMESLIMDLTAKLYLEPGDDT